MEFNKLKEEVKKIPISSVLESWEPESINGRCCFHEDDNPGSFKYTDNGDKGGVFTCFCCGETGDKIDFVMKHDKVDFKEANLRIAYRFGIIDQDDYAKASKNPSSQPVEKREFKTKKKVKEAKRYPSWFLDSVYRQIAEIFGLSEEHKKYLLGRGVKEEELKEYFTFKDFDETFFETAKTRYRMSKKDYLGIPGFYAEGGKVKGRKIDGIGILLKDPNGLVEAVQIRKDGELKPGEVRYSFFSSVGLAYGCSCGAPADVVGPDLKGSIFITEGHFKAYRLNDHFKKTVISVQGVNNTKCLDETIPLLISRRPIRRFIIAFDADLVRKPEVKRAAVKLENKLLQYNIPIRYMIWDEKYGKGADDVIIANHADKFRITEKLEEV